ncbi:hypothetical protein AVEN_95165-1 [Araneus ventricosus]|uniref:Uncharacterized protein n=1 Tax=Araneus ventricosus TaxID=182803 RepID=A0A4Y2KHH2_ARAVE|nr:hypothetical protein AVEN_95165-1 [Araneus ventricosus]
MSVHTGTFADFAFGISTCHVRLSAISGLWKSEPIYTHAHILNFYCRNFLVTHVSRVYGEGIAAHRLSPLHIRKLRIHLNLACLATTEEQMCKLLAAGEKKHLQSSWELSKILAYRVGKVEYQACYGDAGGRPERRDITGRRGTFVQYTERRWSPHHRSTGPSQRDCGPCLPCPVVYLGPCPSGVPWCMTTTWSTTYVVEKCDVMWKLPHPVLTGGSERQLWKLTFGIDLSNYNVG